MRLRVIVTLMLLVLATATGAPAANPSPAALLPRPADGTEKIVGLEAVITSGKLPHWPVELASGDCWWWCSDWAVFESALKRAARWMAAFPVEPLRFDAA